MKKIAENDKCIFYENAMTGEYKGYRVLLAKNKKTGKKDYITINKNNDVIHSSQSIEAIYCRIDFISLKQ